jgi:hypothetical protein
MPYEGNISGGRDHVDTVVELLHHVALLRLVRLIRSAQSALR